MAMRSKCFMYKPPAPPIGWVSQHRAITTENAVNISTFILVGLLARRGGIRRVDLQQSGQPETQYGQSLGEYCRAAQQRHDELPKLVETCKRYLATHGTPWKKSAAALSAVARRASCARATPCQAEEQLRIGLGELYAVAEAYPELQA